MKRGSIELARSICNEIADDGEEEVFASIDVAEILSAEVMRLREEVKGLRTAVESAESILRYCPQINTNCNGTRPNMTTSKALSLLQDEIGRQK